MNNTTPNELTTQENTVFLAEDIVLYDFKWLKDENLFRDEAIITALSNSPIESKLNTIEAYFETLIQDEHSQMDNIQHYLTKNEEIRQEKKQQITNIENEIEQNLLKHNPTRSYVLRYYWSLVMYVIISVLNFYVIWLWLSKASIPMMQSLLIGLGIYLWGMFSLYNRNANIYKNNTPQKAKHRSPQKTFIEEYGIPLIATLFIAFWNYEKQNANWVEYIIFITFTTTLFVFSGKAFLQLLLSHETIQNKKEKRKQEKELFAQKQKEKQELTQKLHLAIETLQKEKEKQEDKLPQIKNNITRHENQKRLALQYFKSEYDLAQEAKKAILSATQIQELIQLKK